MGLGEEERAWGLRRQIWYVTAVEKNGIRILEEI